jgi:hypothetical protein
MGSPLSSGRQVCANCGWSTAPLTAKDSTTSSASEGGLGQIIGICLRIIRRTISLTFAFLKRQMGSLLQASKENRPQAKKIMKGVTERLSSLEQGMQTADGLGAWMTVEGAFKFLGGNPSDLRSEVRSRDGAKALKFYQFKAMSSASDFQNFGLDYSQQRRDENKPCLKWRSPS